MNVIYDSLRREIISACREVVGCGQGVVWGDGISVPTFDKDTVPGCSASRSWQATAPEAVCTHNDKGWH